MYFAGKDGGTIVFINSKSVVHEAKNGFNLCL
jgi:hypothetical protein